MRKKQQQTILKQIYDWLFNSYGPQGWWPVMIHRGKNPTMTGNFRGYHPGEYTYPKNSSQRFEICIGAILTQNTAWANVEKALLNLKQAGSLSPRKIQQLNDQKLKELIRPAGYYNQKAQYVRNFTELYLSLKGRVPGRDEILCCKGVGDETADSMLLYAYGLPEFVIDAYTKRIYSHLGFCKRDVKYMDLKMLFESNLPEEVILFQEYHALIVEHAKRYYNKKPYGISDPLLQVLK